MAPSRQLTEGHMSAKRPLSQLIHFPVQESTGGPAVITLHNHNQFAKDIADWGISASPTGSVKTLESYKGVFVGKEISGYTWFLGPMERPSPIFFGDSLSEIERFLWDEIDRSAQEAPELPYLLGVGQGGIMALATALAVPELVSGVVAINTFLPKVPGWSPPLAPMNNLPVLLVNPVEIENPGVLSGDELIKTLGNWEVDVSSITQSSVSPDTLGVSEWIRNHGVESLVR